MKLYQRPTVIYMMKLRSIITCLIACLLGSFTLAAQEASETKIVYVEFLWDCGETECSSCRKHKVIVESGRMAGIGHGTEDGVIFIRILPTLGEKNLEVVLTELIEDENGEKKEGESKTINVTPEEPVELNFAGVGLTVSGGLHSS